jgi:hypothetical protein
MRLRSALLLLSLLSGSHGFVGKDGLGRLPAMGFNSWNRWGCNINEQIFLDTANKIVELGLKVRSSQARHDTSNGTLGCWLRIRESRRLLVSNR